MAQNRIVALGFLTRRDLEVLGQGFTRVMSVQDDDMFADLLDQLSDVEATSLGDAVMLHRKER